MFRQPGSSHGLSSPQGYNKRPTHPHQHQEQEQQQQQPQVQQLATQYAYARLPAPSASPHGPVYTRLGQNIVAAVNDMTPSPADVQVRQVVIQLVSDACHGALPQYAHSMQVKPFGSFVSGLGTHDSDVDLVVTGVMVPAYGERVYGKAERPVVASFLDKIARALRQCRALQISKLLTIRHARVPVSKVSFMLNPDALPYHQRKLLPSGCPKWKVSMDISVATDSGPQAAQHMAQQARAYPALRPLGLIIKTYLKALDLNDVACGGLSSYGLMYMVVAHIMAEQQEGGSVQDLAWLLHRFFIRYGYDFDTHTQAISTKHGGIVHRSKVPDMKYDNMDRICCIDPLTGHDCTEGTFASQKVLSAFEGAASFLDRQAAKNAQGCPPGLNVVDELLRLRGYFTEDGWRYGGRDLDDTYLEPPAKLLRTAQGDVATGSNSSRHARNSSQAITGPAQGQLYGYQYPDAHTQAGLDAGSDPPQVEIKAKTTSGQIAEGAKRSGSNAMKGAASNTGAAGNAAFKGSPDAAHQPAANRVPIVGHKPAAASTTPVAGSMSSVRSDKSKGVLQDLKAALKEAAGLVVAPGPGPAVIHRSSTAGRAVTLAVTSSSGDQHQHSTKDEHTASGKGLAAGTARPTAMQGTSSGGVFSDVDVRSHTRHGPAEGPLGAQPQMINIQVSGQSSGRAHSTDGTTARHGSNVSPAPHVGKHMPMIHIPGVGQVAGWSGQGSRAAQQGPGRAGRSPGRQQQSTLGKRQHG